MSGYKENGNLLFWMLFVFIVGLFPLLDGITKILLEEEEVWGSVGDSELTVHVGVTEVELRVEVDATQVL